MLDSGLQTPYRELAQVMSDHARRRKQGPVNQQPSYTDLQQAVTNQSSLAGKKSWNLIWDVVDSYLDNSVKTAHPQYFNQLWAGQSDPAMIGAIVEVISNTSMYTFEVAPLATVIENELISVFRQHLGLETWAAQMTTGGSNSNFLALLLALHRRFPDYQQTGLPAGTKPRVYISADAHYSMEKALMMSGLGLHAAVKVAVDENGAMDMQELHRHLQQDTNDGHKPLLIVGTAGTTVRGAFDPIEDIADAARRHNCWFHIDAAWGGAIRYSTSQGALLKSIDQADSFSWDAHKMLGVPLMCSMLFTKQHDAFRNAFRLGDTSYIFHDAIDANEQSIDTNHDLGPDSLQCGRRVDALKMWLEFLFYGKEGFQRRIDQFLDLSALAEQRIATEPELELQAPRWINNICFRSKPEGISDEQELNQFNQKVRQSLMQSGKSMVNQAYLDQALTIRLIIANKDVTESDISQFFDNWIAEASELKREWHYES